MFISFGYGQEWYSFSLQENLCHLYPKGFWEQIPEENRDGTGQPTFSWKMIINTEMVIVTAVT